VAELLLKAGAAVDRPDSHLRTPLFVASNNFHYPVVELLVKNGADVNARDEDKRTPLEVACMFNGECVECISKLEVRKKEANNVHFAVVKLHVGKRVMLMPGTRAR
jgi:hypothetical protein